MALNHDQFIASANYQQLDALLDWYIATIGPKADLLSRLVQEHPDRAVALYQRDPVLRKLRKIADAFRDLMEAFE